MLNQNKENIKHNIALVKKEYENKVHDFAIATADGDVARVIATEERLLAAEIFDVFLDEIRKKHRDEEVDWFDFTNEEVEDRLSDEEELVDYCKFLASLIEDLEERMEG